LNLEYFIAKRLITAKSYKSSISSPIIKIAIAAISIGIVMMIVSVATGVGLQNKIREKVAAFNGHIVVTNFDDNQSEVNTFPISINEDFYTNFKNYEFVDHIQAVAHKAGIIRTENSVEGVILKGVGKDYVWTNIEEYLVKGRLPNYGSDLNEEVLISEYLSKRLSLNLGDKFNTFFMKESGKMPNLRNFKIVGIYNSGFQEFDAAFVIGDIRHVQRINKWKMDQVGAFEVFIKDFTKIKEIGDKVYKEIPPTYNSVTIKEKYYSIFEFLKLFDFNIIVILIVMVVVATINMVVALLVLILERTQMIGVLKALGANNWNVRKIFLYNAGFLIFRGLLFGNVIALGLLLLQKVFGIIKLNPESYYVSEVQVDINLMHILVLNLGTIVVCLLVLLIPSYIITKISPVKAIRFD
jgi:lipoprotein-releasing system permease protein